MTRIILISFLALTLILTTTACSDEATPSQGEDGSQVAVDLGVDTGQDASPDQAAADSAAPDGGAGVSYLALGTLGGSQSAAFGLNASGQVVGWARGCGLSFERPPGSASLDGARYLSFGLFLSYQALAALASCTTHWSTVWPLARLLGLNRSPVLARSE